jgi:hypothetical protein
MELPAPLPYDRDGKGATYLYRIRIHSDSGAITTAGNSGERYLGAFVRIELPELEGKIIGEDAEPEPAE